ncbi:MAG: phosphodiesterase YaeI [Sedimentisphaerales bacterium]|nr:phosphodiesterase YaeI [Sedimentisphaerales bacterium]
MATNKRNMAGPNAGIRLLKRRRFLKSTVATVASMPILCAIDAFAIEPHWVETVRIDLQIKNLPEAFVGKKIVQISDLHCSRVVTEQYLQECVKDINRLQPDIVVLTGDYITYDGKNGYKEKVAQAIGGIKSKSGIFAVLGNHDYGVITRFHQNGKAELREFLTDQITKSGHKVLKNESFAVEIDQSRLWIVGLGDLWAGDFHPEKAFASVPQNEATIALSHNPDTFKRLQEHSADVVLCGHTHGGQVHLPLLGPPVLPVKDKQYHAGLFSRGEKQLYVNRGLGRIGRLRFNCRPEITLFTLTR